ncbi:hypothetical protein JCM18905_4852 [Vibrio sp. JCM 18905]|nr:hypothetical protein JCM18905_4852 [Vibrio sp. JCM 18905]
MSFDKTAKRGDSRNFTHQGSYWICYFQVQNFAMNEAEAELKLPPTNQGQVTLRPHTVKMTA